MTVSKLVHSYDDYSGAWRATWVAMPKVPKYNEETASYGSLVKQGETIHGLQRLYWVRLLLSTYVPWASCLTPVEAVKDDQTHVPTRPDLELVAANFPDPNVTLLSPAFISPDGVPQGFNDGTEGPTDATNMGCFLQSLADRNDWMSYQASCSSSEEGRTLPLVLLSTSSRVSPEPNGTHADKVRVWLQGAVHGNEPAGDQCLLALLGKMDANRNWTSSLLSNVDITILPRYNSDGVADFRRNFATNLDPNRDHIKLASQQTRDIKRIFNDFAPHVAADMHEFSAPSAYGACYRHGADALFSAAKNLNIHESIRNMSEQLFAPAIASALEASDFRWEPYVTGSLKSNSGSNITLHEAGSDPKLARNAMGLPQCISFLCETRGIGLASQHFRRRTATGLAMVEGIIQTASDNATDVLSTINFAIEEFMSSSGDIIITDIPTNISRAFTMIDVNDGGVAQVPITFASTTPTIANLTRRRPLAYSIPKAWSDVAARLTTLGLEVQTLPYTYSGVAEVLIITSVSFDNTYFEGTVPVTVTTTPMSKEIELPAGSFWVSTRQKNTALAVVSLEPEGIDSYVSCNIIPVQEGDEYPIFRIMEA